MDTIEIDNKISRLQQRLDMLRNKEFVPEHQRQGYFANISMAEQELIDLMRQKEQYERKG